MSSEQRPAGLMRRLGAAGPVAIVLSFWPPIGGFILLAFLTALGPWLRGHGIMGMVVYVAVAGVLMGVSFVPTYSCAILAGWAFGFATGFPLAMIAIMIAGWMAYAIGRGIARDRVLEVIRERPKWNAVHRSLLRGDNLETVTVVTLMRIPPAAPYALANFVLAAARVPTVAYTVGTFFGVIPRTAMATFAAAKLAQLRFKDVADRWMVIAGIIAMILVCVILGMMANRALKQITERKT